MKFDDTKEQFFLQLDTQEWMYPMHNDGKLWSANEQKKTFIVSMTIGILEDLAGEELTLSYNLISKRKIQTMTADILNAVT